MAAQYLADGAFVLGLSRRQAADLEADRRRRTRAMAGRPGRSDARGRTPGRVAGRLRARADGALPARVRVIHNAAMLSDPGDIADTAPADLAQSLRIGLEAPVALTAAFLRATAHWSASDRRVLFVSSGLGRRAMAGSAAYCAQKAGLDHFARALALEEAAGRTAPASRRWRRASSIPTCKSSCAAPTRALSGAGDVRRLPPSGALDSPATAAAKVIALLERADYGANPVTDVRA